MIIELSRLFVTSDACTCYLSSIVVTFFNKSTKCFFFNSKQRQGTNVAVFLRPGRPTKKEKRVLKVGRVKLRLLFVYTSFTFMSPSLFSCTILADIWDTELKNY